MYSQPDFHAHSRLACMLERLTDDGCFLYRRLKTKGTLTGVSVIPWNFLRTRSFLCSNVSCAN